MSDEYVVEDIIGRKYENNEIYYKIKWYGYRGSQSSTWEPKSSLILSEGMKNDLDTLDAQLTLYAMSLNIPGNLNSYHISLRKRRGQNIYDVDFS